MKLVVVGFGQCGGRIADEFSKMNKKAHAQRGIDIITGAYAVNTDAADLSGLTSINVIISTESSSEAARPAATEWAR